MASSFEGEMRMPDGAETTIGYVVEVRGDRVIVELTVDTTAPLKDDYYAGQPGSHIKIPFRDRYIIGTVANVRMIDITPQIKLGEEAAIETISRKVAEALLIGTLIQTLAKLRRWLGRRS